jgi:hypothetical protein
MKDAVFWDAALCGSCKNRYFGGTVRPLAIVEHFSSLAYIFPTLKKEAKRSFETSLFTRPAWRHNPKDGILH